MLSLYIKRHIENAVARTAKMFGAVIVTGPRQVGKTTLLSNLTGNITYVSLDDPIILQSAVNEPGTFFKDYPPPVFVDEIQYAPILFPYIKMQIDKTKAKGQFFLSGSQQFQMMKNISESLAGRIGILNLLGLSLREISETEFDKPFIPSEEYYSARKKDLKETEYRDVWKIIHRGSMPELTTNPDFDWQTYYASYVKAYIERDVRELTQVGDELKFLRFMTVVAARSGQLLNLASIARDVGVSQPTADRWTSVLKASGVVYLLEPYHNNVTKRAVKTPKVYFLDTGLAAYLTRWPTDEPLRTGAQAGSFFESFVVAEIIKSYYNAGILEPPLYFYRDKEQNEIDLLIHENGTLHPIEIKKNADPGKSDVAAFSALDKIAGVKRGPGGVVCMYDNLVTLTGQDRVIPVKYL
ncbi:MAG: ATP-binding protein [Oscillospiraceae bacterium]|nr:ATP-binding protein [Oscillospiraceae bacterium]